MLGTADIQPMLPVKDLAKAERFYTETLGLKKVEDQPGVVVVYQSGDTRVSVYRSEFAGTNRGTAALWTVQDIDATVKELKSKGVSFEHYDLPGLKVQGDVHVADGFKVAWFKDPAGNILSIQSAGRSGRA
jgi:catechol 2,3-dioxygenase-like lactoylglutathione lyase family enzyme